MVSHTLFAKAPRTFGLTKPMLPTSPESRAAFWAGVRDILIVSPSYVPFALVCGVAAANVGMSPSAALALPALVFGGSSQAVVLQFLMGASTVWIAVLSGLVVNLRMAIYSAAMAPKVRQLSTVKRMAAAAFLVDNAFAFIQRRETTHPEDGKSGNLMWYYTGLTCILWPNWVVFCGVGYLAGNVIPSTWQLDFAIPLSFIAMLGMHVHSKPAIAASVVGGLASLWFFDLPLKLGLIAACIAGLCAGLAAEQLERRFGQAKT